MLWIERTGRGEFAPQRLIVYLDGDVTVDYLGTPPIVAGIGPRAPSPPAPLPPRGEGRWGGWNRCAANCGRLADSRHHRFAAGAGRAGFEPANRRSLAGRDDGAFAGADKCQDDRWRAGSQSRRLINAAMAFRALRRHSPNAEPMDWSSRRNSPSRSGRERKSGQSRRQRQPQPQLPIGSRRDSRLSAHRYAGADCLVAQRAGQPARGRDQLRRESHRRWHARTWARSTCRPIGWSCGRWPMASPISAASGHIQSENTPLEVYMEGNVVFRQGTRIVQAAGDVLRRESAHRHRAQCRNSHAAAQRTPRAYNALVRFRAAVLRQVEQDRYVASNADFTTSRMGEPTYDISPATATYTDKQHPVFDLFGNPVVDPSPACRKSSTSSGSRATTTCFISKECRSDICRISRPI